MLNDFYIVSGNIPLLKEFYVPRVVAEHTGNKIRLAVHPRTEVRLFMLANVKCHTSYEYTMINLILDMHVLVS